jgi:Flp pilus assembly protein TadG
MRALMLRRMNDDRGATAVIIALCLVAIFAMLMLTVDVGGLLYKRRELVNGADAAALAAAQSCASTTDSDDPEVVADQYAAANVKDLAGTGITSITNITAAPGCDVSATGHVTVDYTMPQNLFFAQVLGISGSKPVRAVATATWGPTGGGNAVPIVVDSGTIQGACQIPDGVKKGDHCNLWYNNGNLVLGDANWGFMNLDQWNVQPTDQCSSAGGANNRGNYIQNDFGGSLTLNGNPPGSAPTYVCGSTGKATSNWSDLRSRIGDVVLFPVNDCSGQLDNSGNVSPCPSAPDKYDIIGFVALLLTDVLRGDDPAAYGSPGASGTCQGSTVSGHFNAGQVFPLSNLYGTSGCPSSTPDTLTNVNVTTKNGNGYTSCPASPCDYTYEASSRTITWGSTPTNANAEPVKISFDWSFNGTAGACGNRTSDPNALCLVTEWRGFQSGPGPAGNGTDFGVRSIRLCDLALGNCLDQ